MYNVLIVDDEEIIARGLTTMIPWDKYDCQVVGTASNGIEALELIRKMKPAIIFSDICMPQMDGLTMIAALRTECPNVQVSILTGYRDFDYAREALHLGVARLLVKPSRMDELNEAVECMVSNLKAAGVNTNEDLKWYDENDESEVNSQDESDEGAKSLIVNSALEYIRENYNKQLRLEDVANHVFVSQWHLSKLINKKMGQNFSEVLNSIRVEKSKEMLRNPEYKVTEIAELVGFGDIAHYSRVFKKYTGYAPTDYRNEKL